MGGAARIWSAVWVAVLVPGLERVFDVAFEFVDGAVGAALDLTVVSSANQRSPRLIQVEQVGVKSLALVVQDAP